jgi:serine/threonine protein kinase
LIQDPLLWKFLNEIKPLPINARILKTHCLVERRSKGKLFRGIDRITKQLCTVRKIFLDVTNAGHDDGLPTSVLRELSHLRSISHPNLCKVLTAEVKGEIAQICFEHHEYNLKEYIKKYNEENKIPATPTSLKGLSTKTIKTIIF